jgi:uncharacterized membrane protein
MMKSLAVIVALVSIGSAMAQPVVQFENGKSKTYTVALNGSTDCHMVFKNVSGSMMKLVYQKIDGDYNAGWWVSFCDNYDCFASFIPRDTFAPIPDQGSAEWKITATPNKIADTSTVRYAIWEANSPNIKDTISFTFMAAAANKAATLSQVSYNVYPNPATQGLTVDGLLESTTYTVMSIEGRALQTGVIGTAANSIDIAALPVGTYTLELRNASATSTEKFVKI